MPHRGRGGRPPRSRAAAVDGRTIAVGGDVVLEVQGISITGRTSYEQIQERLGRLHPGAQLTMTILREGTRVERLGQLP